MKNLECLVLLSILTYVSDSVNGIRVPSAWNEIKGQENNRHFNGGIPSNNRFNFGNQRQMLDNRFLQRRLFLQNEQANAIPGTLYNTMQNSALQDFLTYQPQAMILNANGFYLPPQNANENLVVDTQFIQPKTEIPHLKNSIYPQNTKSENHNTQYKRSDIQSPSLKSPRYTENQEQQEELLTHLQNIPALVTKSQLQKYQTTPLQTMHNQAYDKYPRDMVHIGSSPVRNNIVKVFGQQDQTLLGQPLLYQFTQEYEPVVREEHTQTPSVRYNTQSNIPPTRLRQGVPKNHKFIVPASDEEVTASPTKYQSINPLTEQATRREPIFFVTEGYRNVLVQGPNKKKYQGPKYQDVGESRKVLRTNTLEKGDEKENYSESVKPSRKRKVTKIYKIHSNEDRPNGGSDINLVLSGKKKPKYFERPQLYIEDSRKPGLQNRLTKNYRDDQLYEPSDDNDSQREIDDNERIKEDDRLTTEELEEEDQNERDDNTDDTEDDTNEETFNLNKQKDAESQNDEDEQEEDDEETKNEEEEEEQQKAPYSEHADPKPIPTKPSYPGEGAWAKPGVKHRPYISQHRFLKPQDDEQKPDGYDVFEELEQYFDSQKNKVSFGKKTEPNTNPTSKVSAVNRYPTINPPNPVNPLVIYDPFNEPSENILKVAHRDNIIYKNQKIKNNEEQELDNPQDINIDNTENEDDNNETEENNNEEEEYGDKKSKEFVPMQIYTQVRNSENVEHEPHDPLEHGSLREVLRDSKIHTVYTEEGYEDAAYDHAGHEKKAEQNQEHEEIERNKQIKDKSADRDNKDNNVDHSNKVLISNPPISLEDSLPADSLHLLSSAENIIENFNRPKQPNKKLKVSKHNNLMTTQEVKTTQVTDKQDGGVQLEIESEIKTILQPNNSTKAHKYIKIYPKEIREFSKDNSEIDVTKTGTPSALKNMAKLKNITSSMHNMEKSNNEGEFKKINIRDNLNIPKENVIIEASEKTTISTPTESFTTANVIIKAYKDEFHKYFSTEKPKVTVKVLDDQGTLKKISEQFGKIGKEVRRRKRAISPDDTGIHIDIGFIDKINHTFAEKKKSVIDFEKYPYYFKPDISVNSPLRYAENLDNIPVKKEGELSFYNHADKHECPDIPQNVDPVPEHVKNAHKNQEQIDENEEQNEDDFDEDEGEDDSETNDNEESEDESYVDQKHPPTPKTPRIQLGDKIDCLKVRYFGENPLDNPIFKEKSVGPVLPIFKELQQKSSKIMTDSILNSNKKVEKVNKINKTLNEIDKPHEKKDVTRAKDKSFITFKESVLKDKFSDIENANAETIRTNVKVTNRTNTAEKSHNQLTNPTPASLVTLITTPKYTIQLTPKNIYDQIKLLDHLPEDEEEDVLTESMKQTTEETTTEVVVQKRVDHVVDDEKLGQRKSKMLLHNSNQKEEVVHDGKSPEAQALGFRRLRPRKPLYQIFDVNRFLTTTPFSIIQPAHSTVLPKYKVISEVFYKDEIKPNEQLNVFADVLNNIKNSTNIESIPLQSPSDFGEPSSVTISNLEENNIASPNIRVKKFQMDSSTGPNFLTPSSIHKLLTTEKHYNGRFPQSYEEHQNTELPIPHHFANHNFYNSYKPKFHSQNISNTQKKFVSEEDLQQFDITPGTKIGTRKVLKRRRKPTSTTTSTTFRTTTNINVPTQHTPSNHRPYVIDFIEDTEYVMGLVPPEKHSYKTIVADSEVKGTNEVPKKVYEYRTIPPNAVTEHITNKSPAPVTEIISEDPPTRAMNKYLFVGLKPPTNQKARPYSDFIATNTIASNNVIRRVANIGNIHDKVHIRKKRASAKGYSEVSRNRGRQNEGLEELAATDDDVDDYVPHRPKNYHYDEKTGKIVYHKKQAEKDIEEEDEEYDEIEIPEAPGKYLEKAEDATHPTPKKATTKPLLATATPPPAGKGLLDFVAQLKNNPSYKFYPDPTTSEPGSEPITEATVTIAPKSTSPPEFLQILSKVRTDSSYKLIEDPKKSSSKTSKNKNKSTTSEPEYENEDEEEEYEDEDGGAPKKRFVRQTDLLIFNVGDYLPKIRVPISSPIPKTPTNFIKKHIVERIFPKLRYMTPFDIAKEKIREKFYNTTIYKLIQKNIQNSPGGQTPELSNIQIFDIGDYIPKVKPVSPKTTIDYSKYKTIERPRNRHNMSSSYDSEDEPDQKEERRPVYMEERESIDRPVISEEKVIHQKTDDVASKEVVTSTTQKIVQFRRGTRPTTQKTTPESVESLETTSTKRTVNRRRPVSSITKTTRRPATVEVTDETELVEKIYPQNYEPAKRVYRRRPVRIRHTTERQEENEDTIDRIMRRSLDLKKYDSEQEFRRESIDKEKKDSSENKNEDIDKDHNQESFEIKSNERVFDDKDKETVSDSDTENVDDNGATIKKNKQYFEEDNIKEGSNSEHKKEDVEVFNKDYDPTKKHGGNYKKENIIESIEEAKTANAEGRKFSDKEIVVDESEEMEESQNDKNDNVDIVNENFDKTKIHGGNYKSEEDAVKDELLETNNKPAETQLTQGSKLVPLKKSTGLNDRNSGKRYTKENYLNKHKIKYIPISDTTVESIREISRLTDVVPKPDHFYTDTQLPKEVNKLNVDGSKSQLDYEELEQVTKVGDVGNDEDIVEKYISDNRRANDIASKTSNEELVESNDRVNESKLGIYEETDSKDVKNEDKREALHVSTKKPLFIKDPSKRLYFYAPI